MSSSDEDYKYALELHKRLNGDIEEDYIGSDIKHLDFNKTSQSSLEIKRSNSRSKPDGDDLNRTQNLVHPQWEILDPTPDIIALFCQFDTKFFQSRLRCVNIEWSRRMFSCAGICYSRKNHFGMDVTIRLSEPLLKLRPRKDLVETMLHEMIHAYCFVLHIREGNGGHGPQFKKIMNAINQTAGTNITVYHSFHDEVKLYKQHWWRCNGACQNRSPFFGYVKRTCNRAPGPNDIWWSKHQRECNGIFIKIKEPDQKNQSKGNKKSEKENDKKSNGNGDLRTFFTPKTKVMPTKNGLNGRNANVKGLHNLNKSFKGGSSKTNGGGTMLLDPRVKTGSNTNTSISKVFPPTSHPGLASDSFNSPTKHSGPGPSNLPRGNLHNVVSFKDISTNIKSSSFKSSNWGRGNSLSNDSSPSSTTKGQVDRQLLRNIWTKRFSSFDADYDRTNNSKKHKGNEDDGTDGVNRKRSDPNILVKEHSFGVNNKSIVYDLSSDEDSDKNENDIRYELFKPTIHKNMTAEERQIVIKKEICDDSVELCDSDIEIIDDEFDDNFEDSVEMVAASELADISIIDEFFGEDTLRKEFQATNDLAASASRSNSTNDDIVACPICQTKICRSQFAEHLNGCTGINEKIVPNERLIKNLSSMTERTRKSDKHTLRDAGYSEADLAKIVYVRKFDEDECEHNSLIIKSSKGPSA
uniref:Protein with SprT-like domain at the N terminus n=1 Tax=Glossina brevipalpis TaxID=37001 RepID=A0A1A9X5A8_9MUSC